MPGSTTSTVNTQRVRSGGFLAERLRAKGWTIRDAADFLGVSRQRLYTVFQDPGRARLWECAIAGMPDCTSQMVTELKAKRTPKKKPAADRATFGSQTNAPPEFELGDLVSVLKVCGIADEDTEGEIAGIKGSKRGKNLQLLVKTPLGEDWFPEEDFHEYFSCTGLNRFR